MCEATATVLILASGRGKRYQASGGQGSKLEAVLNGKPVLQHTLDAVRASGLPFHLEAGPHPGMGDSIAAAVRATPDANGWLILPGDLPLIQSDTLRRIAHALRIHSVVLPVFQGMRGHPVGFSVQCRTSLLKLEGSEGGRQIIQANIATELIVNDIGFIADIDTVDDLEAAKKILNPIDHNLE